MVDLKVFKFVEQFLRVEGYTIEKIQSNNIIRKNL
jgi:hypothetical protein